MKKFIFIFIALFAAFSMAKGKGIEIPGTTLIYNGDGSVSTTSVSELSNYPFGSLVVTDSNTVVAVINVVKTKNVKIQPANPKTGSQDSLALILHGDAKNVQIDFSQAKGKGKLPYVYLDGLIRKLLIKGLGENAGFIVAENIDLEKGLFVQNISKKGAGIKAVITSGKLFRVQSNHGIIGTQLSDAIPGGVLIGEDSPKAQIKAKGGLSKVLICKNNFTNDLDFVAAFYGCINTTSIVSNVESVSIKKINAKKFDNVAVAANVAKKIKEKKVTLSGVIAGKDNFVE